MNTRRLAGRLQRRAIRPAHRLITSYCSALTRRVAWPRGRVDSTQAFIRRTSRSGGKSRLLRVPCCGGGRRGEVRHVAQGRSAHALVRDPLRAHPRISSLVESIPESLEDPLLVVGVGGALEHHREKVFELAVFHVLERLGLGVGERMGSRSAGRAAKFRHRRDGSAPAPSRTLAMRPRARCGGTRERGVRATLVSRQEAQGVHRLLDAAGGTAGELDAVETVLSVEERRRRHDSRGGDARVLRRAKARRRRAQGFRGHEGGEHRFSRPEPEKRRGRPPSQENGRVGVPRVRRGSRRTLRRVHRARRDAASLGRARRPVTSDETSLSLSSERCVLVTFKKISTG